MELTFLGHACFLLDDGTYKVIIDPHLSGNPLAAAKPEDIDADFICVTHGHGDHIGDSVEIAKRTGATVFCTVDLAGAVYKPAGVKAMGGNLGGTAAVPFGSVKIFPAIHGSGVAGGLACGFVIEIDGKKIYHAGDTALMTDMTLLEEEGIDVALLPIGDFYTMGPKDALRAVKMIRPGLTVPMHYNTFPAIRQDPAAFAASVTDAGFAAKVLNPGESISL